jgi:hypothetical protein
LVDQHVLLRVLPRQPSLSAVFYPNFPAHTPDFATVFANRGVKPPDLRLRRNPPGTPLPRPVQADILRLDKKPVLSLFGPAKAA